MKYAWIDGQRDSNPLQAMCELLGGDQRLCRLEEMRRVDAMALERTIAGPDPLGPCGIPASLRIATHHGRIEIPRHSGQPGSGQALDEG